jgi:hypothetical protein
MEQQVVERQGEQRDDLVAGPVVANGSRHGGLQGRGREVWAGLAASST